MLTVPVAWALNQPDRTGFRLGPVSEDIRAGQTFVASEAFDIIAVPVLLGAPIGNHLILQATLQAGGLDGTHVASSLLTTAYSRAGGADVVEFPFETTVPGGTSLYFEIQVPRSSPWPVFLTATQGDRDSTGRLVMNGTFGHADQDLIYQLLRQQSVFSRMSYWWTDHLFALVVSIALITLVHVLTYTTVRTVSETVQQRLPRLSILAITVGSLVTVVYFALVIVS
jgi:hypothetical protein